VKEALGSLLSDESARKKFGSQLKAIRRYIGKTLDSMDLSDQRCHPHVYLLLTLAQSCGCDVRDLAGSLLGRLDTDSFPVMHFMVLAAYREAITLTLFTRKSRKSRKEVDGEFMKAYLRLLPKGAGRMRKGRRHVTIGSGNRELPLRLDDPIHAALSQRLGFSFLLESSISLYFTEDPAYREDTLRSLLQMSEILYPNRDMDEGDDGGNDGAKAGEDRWQALSHYLFLRIMILSAAGEDEKALELYDGLRKRFDIGCSGDSVDSGDSGDSGDSEDIDDSCPTADIPVPDLYFIASATLIAAQHSLSFMPERTLEMAERAARDFIVCGDQKDTAQALVTLSEAARTRGDGEKALGAAAAAVGLLEGLDLPLPLASARISLGWALLAKNEYRKSAKCFKRAGKEFERKNDVRGYTEAMIGKMSVAFRIGKKRKGRRFLRDIALSLPVKQYPELFAIMKEEAMTQEWLREDRELGQMFQRTAPVRLSRDCLRKIIAYAKDSYPNEFGAALVGKDGVLSDLELLYSSSVNRNSVLFSKYDSAGSRISVDGFVHSHPSGAAIPSKADIHSFTLFVKNLIIGYPFTEGSIAAYDRVGNRLELEIVD